MEYVNMSRLSELIRLLEEETEGLAASNLDPSEIGKLAKSVSPNMYKQERPIRARIATLSEFIKGIGPVDPLEFARSIGVRGSSAQRTVALMVSVLQEMVNNPSKFKSVVSGSVD